MSSTRLPKSHRRESAGKRIDTLKRRDAWLFSDPRPTIRARTVAAAWDQLRGAGGGPCGHGPVLERPAEARSEGVACAWSEWSAHQLASWFNLAHDPLALSKTL